MAKESWFEVDKDGLRELQDGKPKSFILKELLANALDEDVTEVKVSLSHSGSVATIEVCDDSPEGFKDLTDAYTLFRSCAKRPDPSKRGRFNVGEKQVFAVCKEASIITTKGTVHFDKAGRHYGKAKTDRGSRITVSVRMTAAEYNETCDFIRDVIWPDGINVRVEIDGESVAVAARQPAWIFMATLPTVALIDGAMRGTQRQTQVQLFALKPGERGRLYEMGMPICDSDCDYKINVSQRIPMGIDRDTVSEAYLRHLYAEILNVVHEDISEDNASKAWVRSGTTSPRIKGEAIKDVITARYGERVVTYTPGNPVANDDAIAGGFRVVHGSELSSDEWGRIKDYNAIPSSQDIFGRGVVGATAMAPTPEMEWVGGLIERISKRLMGTTITASFVKSGASVRAQYENQHIMFNVSNLSPVFFNPANLAGILDLCIHELGHYYGHHTESSYHQGITFLGSRLIDLAIREPDFFNMEAN